MNIMDKIGTILALAVIVGILGGALTIVKIKDRRNELVFTNGNNSELCYNQTSEFEWRQVNGKLYCLDNGKWVKAKGSKDE